MGKKELREFEIHLYRLDNKQHTFNFNVDSNFFHLFENSFIENGSASVELILDKSETMLQLHFSIEARLELTCDVSLKKFWINQNIERSIILKYGNEEEELSEDVRVILMDTQSINVAFYIYEFISLEVPMKKIHPDLEDVERPDLVYTSEEEKERKNDEEIDPRWEVLKNLKS